MNKNKISLSPNKYYKKLEQSCGSPKTLEEFYSKYVLKFTDPNFANSLKNNYDVPNITKELKDIII